MGAPVIRTYALAYPEHVAGLVAADGQLDQQGFGGGAAGTPLQFDVSREFRETMIRGMFIPETPAELQDDILTMMLAPSDAVASSAMAAMLGPANRFEGVVEAPALGVFASTGQGFDVERTRAVIPNFNAEQIPGTGHYLMM
jgi:pimeloyl-ACP methyl ester carboxylesterase